jgi:hypothetical protein
MRVENHVSRRQLIAATSTLVAGSQAGMVETADDAEHSVA